MSPDSSHTHLAFAHDALPKRAMQLIHYKIRCSSKAFRFDSRCSTSTMGACKPHRPPPNKFRTEARSPRSLRRCSGSACRREREVLASCTSAVGKPHARHPPRGSVEFRPQHWGAAGGCSCSAQYAPRYLGMARSSSLCMVVSRPQATCGSHSALSRTPVELLDWSGSQMNSPNYY